jgi:hypothetical protein
MKRYAPLLTLFAVAVLGGALFLLNTANDPANQTVNAGPVAIATPTTAVEQPAAPPTTESPPPAVAERAYTGRSSGNEVTVAIAVKDGRAVAYVCDGKKIEAWLEGTVSGKDVTLKSADGGSTITGTVDEAASLGTVAVQGKQWPYSAKAVVAPAGLYEGRANIKGVANRIGWIVLNDGTQTGNRNAGGELQAAPPLDPTRLNGVVIDGAPVTVTPIGGGDPVIAR